MVYLIKDAIMTAAWLPEQDATPTLRDVEFMASTLEGRHGSHAAGVAEFFASLHSTQGDTGRSWAWAGVAMLVRKREQDRITSP